MTKVEKLAEYSRNACWFYDSRESLRPRFPDKYVLILGQEVVDSDESFDALAARLEERGPEAAEMAALEFVSKDASSMLLCA